MVGKERFRISPAALLVMEKDNQVLFLRRAKTGYQDGQYTLPSGKVDIGESPLTAACREAQEEVGVQVNESDVVFEQVLYRVGYNATSDEFDTTEGEWADFFFSTQVWQGEPHIGEPGKCDEIAWFDPKHLPENVFPGVKRFFMHYPNHAPYEDAGLE